MNIQISMLEVSEAQRAMVKRLIHAMRPSQRLEIYPVEGDRGFYHIIRHDNSGDFVFNDAFLNPEGHVLVTEQFDRAKKYDKIDKAIDDLEHAVSAIRVLAKKS